MNGKKNVIISALVIVFIIAIIALPKMMIAINMQTSNTRPDIRMTEFKCFFITSPATLY